MPVAVFIVMFCAGLTLLVMAGASTKGASDARIVNLLQTENNGQSQQEQKQLVIYCKD